MRWNCSAAGQDDWRSRPFISTFTFRWIGIHSRSGSPDSIVIRAGFPLRAVMSIITSINRLLGAERAFEGVPRTPRGHFNLWSFGAVLHLIDRLKGAGALEAFPFLKIYLDDAQASIGSPDPQEWRRRVIEWERAIPVHLPLRALRDEAGIDVETLLLLLTIG